VRTHQPQPGNEATKHAHTEHGARPTNHSTSSRSSDEVLDGWGRQMLLLGNLVPSRTQTHMPLITVASLAATRRHVRQQASVFFLSWHDFFFTPSSAISWLRRARVALAWLAGASSHAAQQGLVVRLWAGGAEETVGMTGDVRDQSRRRGVDEDAAAATVRPAVMRCERGWWRQSISQSRPMNQRPAPVGRSCPHSARLFY